MALSKTEVVPESNMKKTQSNYQEQNRYTFQNCIYLLECQKSILWLFCFFSSSFQPTEEGIILSGFIVMKKVV